jgi:hypothetical protein
MADACDQQAEWISKALSRMKKLKTENKEMKAAAITRKFGVCVRACASPFSKNGVAHFCF